MTVPKINSAHGSDTRNIINAAIDSVNAQGKSIQDLVAEGQLTEEQYAQLITVVNGLISKGNVSVHDIDINLGKIGLRHLSDDVKSALTGETPILSEVADGSVTYSKMSDNAVSPKKTTFFDISNNLFDKDSAVIGESIDHDGDVIYDSTQWISDFIEVPKSKIISLSPQTTSYRLYVYNTDQTFRNRTGIQAGESSVDLNHFTGELLIKVGGSTVMDLSSLMINAGNSLLPYEEYKVQIKEKYQKELPESENTVTIIEDPFDGYPERPPATSVIWIGPNEPERAEMYDEWRDSKGFSYFTDFTEYLEGENLNDWSKPWSNGTARILSSTSSPSEGGSKLMRFHPEGNDFFAVSWDIIDDAYSKDVEIFFRGYNLNTSGAQYSSVLLRGSGSGENFTGYVVGPYYNDLRVSKYVNSESTELIRVETNVDFSEYFNLVARVEDNLIRFKVWQYGESEPKNWHEIIDTEISDKGFIGLFTFAGGPYIDAVGVGTGGSRAPRKRFLHD